MRKFLIGAALAASTLIGAVPASAQYYPQRAQPYGYSGYGTQYGNQYGYGQGRALIARVDQIRQQIRQLDRRGALSNNEAYRPDSEAQQLRYRVRQLSYNGLNSNERYDVERRLARLEQMVRYEANDGNDRYDGRGYGFSQGYQNGNGQYQNGRWQNRDGRWQDQNDRDDRRDDDDRDND